jgi:hypothetical protein
METSNVLLPPSREAVSKLLPSIGVLKLDSLFVEDAVCFLLVQRFALAVGGVSCPVSGTAVGCYSCAVALAAVHTYKGIEKKKSVDCRLEQSKIRSKAKTAVEWMQRR